MKKDYYINRVRDSFRKISDFDLDTYLPFVKSFLTKVWRKNGSVDLRPFLSLFSEIAVWNPSIWENAHSPDTFYYVDIVSSVSGDQKIRPVKSVSRRVSVTYASVIKSPFGEFSFDAHSVDLIKRTFREEVTGQTTDEEIKTILSKWKSTEEESWHKLLSVLITCNFDNSWSRFATEKYEAICFDLVKSLTLGEYFILDRYSANRLDVMIGDEHEFENQGVEELKDRIKAVVSKARTFSKTIGLRLLNHSDSYSSYRPIYVEGFRKHIAYSYSDSTLSDTYTVWSNAVEAVIAIAYIDFFFVSTPENVETLSAAYRRLERLKGKEEITEPNKAKALLLLKKCILHHTKNSNDRKLEHNYLVHDAKFQEIIETSQLSVPDFKIDDNTSQPELRRKVDGHSDITNFNNISYKYLSVKSRQKDIKNIVGAGDYSDNSLKSLVNALDEDIWTVSLLTSAVTYISGDGCADVVRKHFILSSLLDKLRKLTNLYDDERLSPGKFVRPFSQCYYTVAPGEQGGWTIGQKILTEKGYENTVQEFGKSNDVFIISCYSTPVFIDFLKLFIEKYDVVRRDCEMRNREETRRYFDDSKQKIDESTREVERERNKTLQLLGVLGSFIAFVSLAASSLNSVAPELFWSHMLVCTGCIVVLILMIFFISLKDRWWPKWLLAVGLVVLLIFSLCRGPIVFNTRIKSGQESCHCSDKDSSARVKEVTLEMGLSSSSQPSAPMVLINGDITVASETPDTVRVKK